MAEEADVLVVTQRAVLPEARERVVTHEELPPATAQTIRRLGKPLRRWMRMNYAYLLRPEAALVGGEQHLRVNMV